MIRVSFCVQRRVFFSVETEERKDFMKIFGLVLMDWLDLFGIVYNCLIVVKTKEDV